MSTAPHAPVYEALTLVEVLEAGVIFSHECDLCSAKCWRTSSVLLGVPSAELRTPRDSHLSFSQYWSLFPAPG